MGDKESIKILCDIIIDLFTSVQIKRMVDDNHTLDMIARRKAERYVIPVERMRIVLGVHDG